MRLQRKLQNESWPSCAVFRLSKRITEDFVGGRILDALNMGRQREVRVPDGLRSCFAARSWHEQPQ